MVIWEAIGYVSSAVTLVAFIVATIAWSYKNMIDSKEKLIQTANPEDRKDLIIHTLEIFHVDTASLSQQQQYEIVIEQIRERAKRFKYFVLILALTAVSGTIISIYALSKPEEIESKTSTVQDPVSTRPTLPPVTTHSMVYVREIIDTHLSNCWTNQSSSCDMAAESLSNYCARINNNEDPIRQVPDGFCQGLAETLLNLSRSLNSQDPDCIAIVQNSCATIVDDIRRSHCLNKKASCEGLIFQIEALKLSAQTKAGITHFTFSSS